MSDNNRHEVIIGGTGGQGVITIGYVLAEAASEVHKNVSRFPIYMAMQRGGSAYVTVIFSNDNIASPILSTAENIICMEDGSYARYKDSVKKGGKMVVNSSIVNKFKEDADYEVHKIPVLDLAQELGNSKLANMVMLGAYREITGALTDDQVKSAMEKILSGEGGKKERFQANMDSYNRGAEYVRENK